MPIAAPSANKFGHVSPTKAEHVYNDFYLDSEVTILDGGQCNFGIESTVLKIVESSEKFFDLCILRKGGVSEKALLETLSHLDSGIKVNLTAKMHKEFKPETENLEGPGQFLRHYSPNIESFLLNDILAIDQTKVDRAVLIDFGGIMSSSRDKVKHYIDMSAAGSFLEAINNLYDVLRLAETREDADIVLITNILELCNLENGEGREHFDALYDRIYRATSGRKAE